VSHRPLFFAPTDSLTLNVGITDPTRPHPTTPHSDEVPASTVRPSDDNASQQRHRQIRPKIDPNHSLSAMNTDPSQMIQPSYDE
jgi:hypothetical protein